MLADGDESAFKQWLYEIGGKDRPNIKLGKASQTAFFLDRLAPYWPDVMA